MWHEMVAQMTDDSMQYIVEGPSGRSRGLIGCSIYQSNKFDIKMQRANPGLTTMKTAWDFLLWRNPLAPTGRWLLRRVTPALLAPALFRVARLSMVRSPFQVCVIPWNLKVAPPGVRGIP